MGPDDFVRRVITPLDQDVREKIGDQRLDADFVEQADIMLQESGGEGAGAPPGDSTGAEELE